MTRVLFTYDDVEHGPATSEIVDGSIRGTFYWRWETLVLVTMGHAVEAAAGRCGPLHDQQCWACLARTRLAPYLETKPSKGAT